MLTLVNTNKMVPPVAPIALDYIAAAARAGGIETDLLDLCFVEDPEAALRDYFSKRNPLLVGLSFRNVDDCFWPSARWFAPELARTTELIRGLTDAPVVLGGVGFSIFAARLVEYTGADFGVRGDGEQAIVSLYQQLLGRRDFDKVEGLVWRSNGQLRCNQPAWPTELSLSTARDTVDNLAYFLKGGQCGLETKRGCDRRCLYCADPLAKGPNLRLRKPGEVADEADTLAAGGIDVLHLCDSEFNIPRDHALAVCEEFTRRGLDKRLRWYTYMAVLPFDEELARAMSKAGCVGIDFTGDSACPSMLRTYRQPHGKEDLARAVKLCRDNGMKVMIDLLLGGPGETEQTLAETIGFIKQIDPDCAGASLGIRIYPGTGMAETLQGEGEPGKNPGVRRKYDGPLDLVKPTFYISPQLGDSPARLVRELIAGDERFFEPMEESSPAHTGGGTPTDHNYNDNIELVRAIEQGARGAYWDILQQLRKG